MEIKHACFLPLFFGVGDHRAILLDIPVYSLLGGDIHKIVRPTSRRLTCSNPEVMEKYNELLETYCIQHKIQKKLYLLFPPHFPPTPSQSRAIEIIDRVLGEGMEYAERKCRKIRVGEVPFSEKIAKVGYKIKLWRLVLRHKATNNVNTCTIRRAAKRCGLKKVLSTSLNRAWQNLKKAKEEYKN